MPTKKIDENAQEMRVLLNQMQADLAVVEEAFNKARARLTVLLDKQKLVLMEKENFKIKS